MDTEKPNFYAIIPASVRYNKSLCPNAKLLYGEITALANSTGYCYASNRYFAGLYDISRLQTISDWIRQLEVAGHISVELIYSGKEIKQRNIRISDAYTYNEKTLEVQRKNARGYNEKTLEGTTKNRCDINTINNTDNNTDKLYGNFGKLPKEETKQGAVVENQNPPPMGEKPEFALWLENKGFSRLAATNFFLKKEKSCAKKEKEFGGSYIAEYGEPALLDALRRIDEYLAKVPNYLDKKTGFAAILNHWIEPQGLTEAKAAFSAFFEAKYGIAYKTFSKADLNGLQGILQAIQGVLKDGQLAVDAFPRFLNRLGEMPSYQAAEYATPKFIAPKIMGILADMQNNPQAKAAPKSYDQIRRDERSERARLLDESIERDSKHEANVRGIQWHLDNNREIPQFLKETQAYADYLELINQQRQP